MEEMPPHGKVTNFHGKVVPEHVYKRLVQHRERELALRAAKAAGGTVKMACIDVSTTTCDACNDDENHDTNAAVGFTML